MLENLLEDEGFSCHYPIIYIQLLSIIIHLNIGITALITITVIILIADIFGTYFMPGTNMSTLHILKYSIIYNKSLY